MDAESVFDKLVSELSIEERRGLLRKLKTESPVSELPMYRKEGLTETVDVENRFAELPLLTRFFFFLRGFFSGRKKIEVYQAGLLRKLGRRIESKCPGIMDFKRGVFLKAFKDEFEELRNRARFFYDALEDSFEKDKGAFFAFLGSLELEFQHQRLYSETDPCHYAEQNSMASDSDIRAAVNSSCEEILGTIQEDQRRSMYQNVRSLFCLKRLSTFLYDRILLEYNGTGEQASCSIYLVQEQLREFANILYSMSMPPSIALLETLFVFQLQDFMEDTEYMAEPEIRGRLASAEENLAFIRQFMERIPLIDILRFATKNINYSFSPISGGEDWFAIYKGFWKKRIESLLASFLSERKKAQMSAEIEDFLRRKELPSLEFVSVKGKAEGPPVRLELALRFLLGFFRGVFLEDMNRPLKILLLDGEFYKKENRIEFADAFNELLKISDRIKNFDSRCGPNGEIGKMFDQAMRELSALNLKRRKLQTIQLTADTEAEVIVEAATKAFGTISFVVKGVLHGDVGGRYDTISNIGFIDGKSNAAFMKNLAQAGVKAEKAMALIQELSAMEANPALSIQ